MPIRVKCESCKKTLGVKDHLAGKKIKCPVCQGVVVVPATSASDPTAAGGPKAPAPKAPPAPKAKPADAAAKKVAPAPKDIATKAPAEKTPPNGSADGVKRNGVPPKKPEPEPVDLPPENVEEEALAAFTDEPAPVEEGPPQMIDFICEFCDAPVHLPLDQAGKRVQCPNDDCRRLIKVPVPKVEGKRDWRKMDRRGPSAAIISQPEELENAWGTETSTRARHDSLAQAGAIAAPKKPPVGVLGWLRRGFLFFCVVGLLGGGGLGIRKLRSTSQQKDSVEQISGLLGAKGKEPKIKNPVLRAEAHRVLAVLAMREPDKAMDAKGDFLAAVATLSARLAAIELEPPAKQKDPAINEQLLLIDITLALTELGGSDDEAIAKKKQRWDPVRAELNNTLAKISSPEVQVLALRELGTHLADKKQKDLTLLALQLTNNLGNPDTNPKPLAFRQHIALVYAEGDAGAKKGLPPEPDLAKSDEIKDLDAHHRVGYAEGYARTGDFKKALELATAKGKTGDRLDACIGVAWVSLRKNRTEAAVAFKEALTVLKEKDANPTSWNQLELVTLGARLDDLDSVKLLHDKLPRPFKLRADLEIFLGKLEKSAATSLDELVELEAKDADGATLGLAWAAWAGTNGASRDQNRKACDNRYPTMPLQPGVNVETLRAMADVGSFFGAKK